MDTQTVTPTKIAMCYGIYGTELPYIVTAVTPTDDHELLVTFVTGERKRFDMKPIIAKGGVFTRLQDIDYFKKAHAERSTVVWGDILDIAPETLYEQGTAV